MSLTVTHRHPPSLTITHRHLPSPTVTPLLTYLHTYSLTRDNEVTSGVSNTRPQKHNLAPTHIHAADTRPHNITAPQTDKHTHDAVNTICHPPLLTPTDRQTLW